MSTKPCCAACGEFVERVYARNDQQRYLGEECLLEDLLRPHGDLMQMGQADYDGEGVSYLYRCTRCRHWWVLHYDAGENELVVMPGSRALLREWRQS